MCHISVANDHLSPAPAASLSVKMSVRIKQTGSDITASANGVVWLIMNKGEIMIIINGLLGEKEGESMGMPLILLFRAIQERRVSPQTAVNVTSGASAKSLQ